MSKFYERVFSNNFILRVFLLTLAFTLLNLDHRVRWIFNRSAISTNDKLEYQFLPVARGIIQFRVQAANDAHIALTTEPREGDHMFEVFIGGWGNTKSTIRKNRSKPDVAEASTPDILSATEQRGFWIKWEDHTLTVGKENEHEPFLRYTNDEPLAIGYFGVATGWNATGEWLIEDRVDPTAPTEVGEFCWCDAVGGDVPAGAVEGGKDGEPLFVGRARHEGALLPGKVAPSHSVCYVAWGGQEHGKTEYQVLCGCTPAWVPTSGNNIPPTAVPSGETEDGETLYVGRVNHEGTVTIGKVQPSHSVCYIPYGGREVAFPDYEIMVSQ